MTDKFEAQIDGIVNKSINKMLVVVREAVTDVVLDSQTPVEQGGKMRVKTGFLRSSGLASLNEPPRGPTRGDPKAGDKSYPWSGEPINIVLAKMKLGDVIYFGWTAHYAKYREAYDGFLDSALQKWQIFVDASIGRFKK